MNINILMSYTVKISTSMTCLCRARILQQALEAASKLTRDNYFLFHQDRNYSGNRHLMLQTISNILLKHSEEHTSIE